MLPDVLVGLFTGKTKSLNMDNSLLPLASIVAGMFVKNPILKMLLMGMGGANLLNKAGHEVLGRKQQEGIAPTVSPAASRIQYRQYLMNHSILVSATRCCKGGVSLPTLTMCLVPFNCLTV